MARTVGLAGHLLERRVRSGEWSMVSPRVLVLTGAPETFERDAWIALFDAGAGAALSHDTALALWKLPGFELRPIHVTHNRPQLIVPIDARSVYHRSRLWPEHHRLLLNDLPVVSPTRALFDKANEGKIHELRLERVINNAWARRLTSGADLAAMSAEWCKRGRNGTVFMRAYLVRHPIDWQPPESNLEGRFLQLIVDAGFPEPRKQRDVGDHAAWIGRVDFTDPDLPLIGEIQSDLFHTAPLDRESDAKRIERLNAAGFHVEQFKEFDVWHDRNAVIEQWRNGREIARKLRRNPA
ncbi:MAG TPA: hypothetical protein VHC63_01835 [Acidimicrobiales bacterium]|nr:hypothetical protein [Acidimicrobiales bacterium]